MKICLVQMEVEDGNPLQNLESAEAQIRAHPGAKIYLLPELWTTGYQRDSWSDYLEQHHAPIQLRLSILAQEQEAWIGGSTVVAIKPKRYANRFMLFPPDLASPASYDKVHLFAPLNEDQFFVAGKRRVDTQLGAWRTNLSICYDLRFPGMYRQSALAGSTLFLIVAQWPTERCHHMVALARSRAIENQAYVAVCNRIGRSKAGLEFGGYSGIWGPNGKQLADAGTKPGTTDAEINLDDLLRLRKDMPLLSSSVKGVDY